MKTFKLALLLIMAGAGVAWAADTKILDHHVASMKAGDLDGVLSDYAPDAVVVTPADMVSPNGVFVGKDIRKLFSVLTSKANVPGNKTMQTTYENLGPDTTLMRWVQFKGTPKELAGYDVFVVRGGKVAFQTVILNPAKK